MTSKRTTTLTLALALAALSLPWAATAQITSASPAALGTANNYTALARGFTAIGLNPAGLAMPGNPGFSMTLLPVEAQAGLSAMTLGDLAAYDGQKIPDAVRQQWLQSVTEDGGFSVRSGVSAAGFALSAGPIGLQVSTVGQAHANLSPDAFELLMFGNAGLTGTPRDMSMAGTSGSSWAATTAALSLGIPLPGVSNGHFGMGATVKYTMGHVAGTALDNGSVVRANPFSVDLAIPSIIPATIDLDTFTGNNGTGIGLDLGLAWEGTTWAFSAAVQNVFHTFQWDLEGYDYRVGTLILDGTSITTDFDATPVAGTTSAIRDALLAQRFEPAINMGIAYRVSDKLALAADFRHDTGEALVIGERSRVGLGAEFQISLLSLRGGVSRVTGGAVQLGTGLGIAMGPVGLSAAYLIEQGSAGEFRAASLAFSYGM